MFQRCFSTKPRVLMTPWSNITTQVSIELEDPKFVPEYVERFQKSFLPFYLFTDGKYTYHKPKLEDVLKMPPTKSTEEACYWAEAHKYPDTQSFCSIAANDKHIAICSNHVVADGGSLIRLIKKIQEPNFSPPELPLLPEPLEVTFANECKKVDHTFSYGSPEDVTYYKSKGELPQESVKRMCRFELFRENTKNFAGYDAKTRKVKGLTDSLWLALTLSMCAMNGKLGPIGCATCVDLRDETMESQKYLNTFTILRPHAPVSPYQTIEELGKLLRNDLMNKRIRGDGFVRDENWEKNMPLKSEAELSQLPPVHFHHPLTDVFFQIVMPDYRNLVISLLGQSNINDDTGENKFIGRLRTSQSQVNDRDAKLILDSIHYFITHIPATATVNRAYEEIKAFQDSYNYC